MPGLPIPKGRAHTDPDDGNTSVTIVNCEGKSIALAEELYASVLLDGTMSLLKTIAVAESDDSTIQPYYPLTHDDIAKAFKPRDEIRIVVEGEYNTSC